MAPELKDGDDLAYRILSRVRSETVNRHLGAAKVFKHAERDLEQSLLGLEAAANEMAATRSAFGLQPEVVGTQTGDVLTGAHQLGIDEMRAELEKTKRLLDAREQNIAARERSHDEKHKRLLESAHRVRDDVMKILDAAQVMKAQANQLKEEQDRRWSYYWDEFAEFAEGVRRQQVARAEYRREYVNRLAKVRSLQKEIKEHQEMAAELEEKTFFEYSVYV